MRVKMIQPALTEAKSPFVRPSKYSLFPPLGLAQLASYFGSDDAIIRAKRATSMVPVLEEVLSRFRTYRPWAATKGAPMETKLPTPIRIALPMSAGEEASHLASEEHLTPQPPLRRGEGEPVLPLPLGEGWGEGRTSPPLAGEDVGAADVCAEQRPGEGSPRFIPLAVAIDLGMTPPIGSIRTTDVEIDVADEAQLARPTRRHLRLIPSPGA